MAVAELSVRAVHARVTAGPTSRPRLTAVVVGNAIGAVVIFVAWLGVSGERDVDSQIGWLCLSGTGLLIAAVSNGVWFAGGRRILLDSRQRMRVIAASRAELGTSVPMARISTLDEDRTRFGAADRMSRYHRDGCVLTRGKALSWSDAGVHEAAGRTPCEVCVA